MRLIGWRGEFNLFYLNAVVKSSLFPNQMFTLKFYVDTGASITAMSDTDAYKNQIPYHNLLMDLNETWGISGTLHTRQLPNSEIFFLTDKKTSHSITYPILRIMDRGIYSNAIYNPRISLLGMDVLQNFRISFQGDRVILDKDIIPPPIPKIPSLPRVKPFKANLPT